MTMHEVNYDLKRGKHNAQSMYTTFKAKRFAKHSAVRCYHCLLASICFCFRTERQNAQHSKVILSWNWSYSGELLTAPDRSKN